MRTSRSRLLPPFVSLLVAAALLTACSSSGRSARDATAGTTTTGGSATTSVPVPSPACPDKVVERPSNSGPGLRERLVPLTARRLVVCRYSNEARLDGRFVVADRVSVDTVERVVNEFGVVPDEVQFNCPTDTPASLLLLFGDGTRVVSVHVKLRGCGFLTNGTRTVRPIGDWVSATLPSLQAAGCPLVAVDAFGTSRTTGRLPSGDLGKAMVPIAADVVRVCRFAPQNDPQAKHLTGFGVVEGAGAVATLEKLANDMRRLAPGMRVPCPFSPTAPAWFLTFTDPNGASVDLIQTPADCGYVENSALTGMPDAAWNAALERVVSSH